MGIFTGFCIGYSQSEIMQELFRKQFSLPKERKDNSPARSNDWDRERER